MPIKHEGLHTYRLTPEQNNPREVAFAEEWKKENSYERRIALLEQLLQRGDGLHLLSCNQQSATVAATVIQWLGSNVGFSFLREALGNCGYEIVEKSDKP